MKLLGRGGFSEVWLATDKMTDVQVALKIYAPGAGLDDEGIKLFTQEFSLVFDMNHSNLLRPTFFNCWERMPYLILPYCKNGSTFKYLGKNHHLTEDIAWNILHDVADGLSYLHGKTPPVIHQDIKPDNILISDEGHFMITDFGISTKVRNTLRRGKDDVTQSGTLAYMGPERFSKNPSPIMPSDIWSLGATMYELLTGDTPFGEHGGVMLKNGAEVPIIQNEEYSNELKELIYMCLSNNSWDRPTARDLADLCYCHIHGIDPEKNKNMSDSLKELNSSLKLHSSNPLGLPADIPTTATTANEPIAEGWTKIGDTAPVTTPADSNGQTGGEWAAEGNRSIPLQKTNYMDLLKNKKVLIGIGVVVVLLCLLPLCCGGDDTDQAPKQEELEQVDTIATLEPTFNEANIAKANDAIQKANDISKEFENYDPHNNGEFENLPYPESRLMSVITELKDAMKLADIPEELQDQLPNYINTLKPHLQAIKKECNDVRGIAVTNGFSTQTVDDRINSIDQYLQQL